MPRANPQCIDNARNAHDAHAKIRALFHEQLLSAVGTTEPLQRKPTLPPRANTRLPQLMAHVNVGACLHHLHMPSAA